MDFFRELAASETGTSVLIVINLIILESMLSLDNAAVLATMVMDLPAEQRGKALRYGILGAYVFRGIALLFVSFLLQVRFLKLLGGLYLVVLSLKYFYTKATPTKKDDLLEKKHNRLYKTTLGLLGPFWSTVLLVEFMDISFSIDNVFAAAAFSDKLMLICTGVFIGILSMRFAAQGFVTLLSRFPFLEPVAFIALMVLGLRLMVSYGCAFAGGNVICALLETHRSDFVVSAAIVALFLGPTLTSILFNLPRKT
ncbi:MAG: membrane protein [Chitinophagales bacterium]|nr:MAG: membrane protein [Chitinophagales bacterium]